jgi:hypothetical protein
MRRRMMLETRLSQQATAHSLVPIDGFDLTVSQSKFSAHSLTVECDTDSRQTTLLQWPSERKSLKKKRMLTTYISDALTI